VIVTAPLVEATPRPPVAPALRPRRALTTGRGEISPPEPRARAPLARAFNPKTPTLRLRPMTERALSYARRFLEAGWGVEETAWLFDFASDDLEAQRRRWPA
ncbi:MAG: hypothetical protein ACXWVJ_04470, partial [Caulobacteraceae bacterium]